VTTPRVEIDLDKIHHNVHSLRRRLARCGISVTGVTKAFRGSTEIANTFVHAGLRSLGDSRIENIKAMRAAGVTASMTLIRAPMLSQIRDVVVHTDISFNTEVEAIRMLSVAAKALNRTHGIVLMVELGDLREGIMPEDLDAVVRETIRLPNLVLKGIGTNLACFNGVSPDHANMAELSALAYSIEARFGLTIDIVSGGNSANLEWALSGADTGRITDLRLGESLLLGLETLHRTAIDGLHTDAISIVAEVIESKLKPTQPWGTIAQTAFGGTPPTRVPGNVVQTILAIGNQDTDTLGLTPPAGMRILGASGDHLVVDSGSEHLAIGSEVSFQPNYSALIRAMTSPCVSKVMKTQREPSPA
jgi:predicted amino acid racemase